MFTGIVHNQATVAERIKKGGQIRFAFRLVRRQRPLKLGESVAVDGVCLTVSKTLKHGFGADVVSETLKATTLGMLKEKGRVNIETSLKVGDTIGGHFVTGHIDGRGQIEKITKIQKNYLIHIKVQEKLGHMVIPKGSVAVDGISLTVQEVRSDVFMVAIIPHTFKETTLGLKGEGDWVNLEVDLMARYMAALLEGMSSRGRKPMALRDLRSKGF